MFFSGAYFVIVQGSLVGRFAFTLDQSGRQLLIPFAASVLYAMVMG